MSQKITQSFTKTGKMKTQTYEIPTRILNIKPINKNFKYAIVWENKGKYYPLERSNNLKTITEIFNRQHGHSKIKSHKIKKGKFKINGNPLEYSVAQYFKNKGYKVLKNTYYGFSRQERSGLYFIFGFSYNPKYYKTKKEYFNRNIENWRYDKRLKEIYQEIFFNEKKYTFFRKYFDSNISKDRERAKGIPDLFVYNDKEYFFIEVKGKNDGLRINQIEWMNKANQNGIKAEVVFVKN